MDEAVLVKWSQATPEQEVVLQMQIPVLRFVEME
jgi:hypothetical protein